MLRVPVVAAIGHERDTTLIDDVAAVACSTPTHAAEAAVPLDCIAARGSLQRSALALRRAGDAAVAGRARHLGALARGPARALRRERTALNQKTREIRAASERRLEERLARPAADGPGPRPCLAAGGRARGEGESWMPCAAPRSRSAPTIPSAPSSAVSPWSRTPRERP